MISVKVKTMLETVTDLLMLMSDNHRKRLCSSVDKIMITIPVRFNFHIQQYGFTIKFIGNNLIVIALNCLTSLK